MQPSSILCRTQESLQRARSAASSLANVRHIADQAAAAWAGEALIAEQRERRVPRLREAEVASRDEARRFDALSEEAVNENPDRGSLGG